MASRVFAATGLATATAAIIFPKAGASEFEKNEHQKDMRLIIRVTATGAFRLNLVTTPDEGAAKQVIKQIASAAVTVDGNTASYTSSAELDVAVSARTQVQIFNATGGSIDYVADIRDYYVG